MSGETRQEKIVRARELRAEGETYREIGEKLGVSSSAAYLWLNPECAKQRARRSNAKFGSLYIEAGSLYHLIRGRWIPDGLHIWLGRYGVHLFWQRSPYARRITLDRQDIDPDLAAEEAREVAARPERTVATNHCSDKRFVCPTCGAGYPVAGTCCGRAADKHSPIETVAR